MKIEKIINKEKCDFLITQMDRKIRDAVTAHTRNLGMRGNAKYIENLIRKDLGI